MCLPSGTRQASTQISQVFFPPPFTGTGTGFSVSMVAQSLPSAPMMCVLTVPVVAGVGEGHGDVLAPADVGGCPDGRADREPRRRGARGKGCRGRRRGGRRRRRGLCRRAPGRARRRTARTAPAGPTRAAARRRAVRRRSAAACLLGGSARRPVRGRRGAPVQRHQIDPAARRDVRRGARRGPGGADGHVSGIRTAARAEGRESAQTHHGRRGGGKDRAPATSRYVHQQHHRASVLTNRQE
jgi:hypothetical protein